MAIRLLCALIAGAVIGLNRGERGKTAGLRTTMLVCLAAAIAMLQMNYLLTLAGRGDNSVMNDLMRLPLGKLRAFPDVAIPPPTEELSRQPGVASLKWRYFV